MSGALQIPGRDEWGIVDRDYLDAACAFDSFFGKSLVEARALFAENALFFSEELGCMPPVPFRFYLRGFVDYLESDDSKGDSDGASAFLDLFDWKLSRFRADLDSETELLMLSTARRIAARQPFYGASVSIYEDFAERLRKTEATYLTPDSTQQNTVVPAQGRSGE